VPVQRFTLSYDGKLKPNGRLADKMAVRRALHPQIANLWTYEPWSNVKPALLDASDNAPHRVECDGHTFAALVHNATCLRAELEILMLRPTAPGRIIIGADIDNQLKTLFDALKCPRSAQEIPTGWTPKEDERPLHCLLEDDQYITRVTVETDRWLGKPPSRNHVRLFIRVNVWAVQPSNVGLRLGI
jgi:hypothetical protein